MESKANNFNFYDKLKFYGTEDLEKFMTAIAGNISFNKTLEILLPIL